MLDIRFPDIHNLYCANSEQRAQGAGSTTSPRGERQPLSKTLKPGTPAPKSGQYQNPGTGTEVTGVKGKPLPPTPRPGQGYKLVDPTKHKS
jgi:hypothetical protein